MEELISGSPLKRKGRNDGNYKNKIKEARLKGQAYRTIPMYKLQLNIQNITAGEFELIFLN